jgi:hypothetical protein
MKRLVPYFLTAAVGLSLGGGASAAGGLVTGSQVKDRSLHPRDFSLRARRALRTARGPRGEQGRRGVAGPPGPPGPIGAASASNRFTATLVAAGPVAANGVEYLAIGARGSAASEGDAQLVLPVYGNMIRMVARVAQPSPSGARHVRLRFNESDTIQESFSGPIEYACSIPPGGLTCRSATAFSGWISGGDRVAVQVTSSSAVATDASVVFELQAY